MRPRHPSRVQAFNQMAAVLLVLLSLSGAPTAGANEITAENARTDGVVPRARWDSAGFAGQLSIGWIEGFSTQFSVAPGDTVKFKVKTPAGSSSYSYEIYRLGWYGGQAARHLGRLPRVRRPRGLDAPITTQCRESPGPPLSLSRQWP